MAKSNPSPENRKVAKHAASAFGGTPAVTEYLHDTEPLALDLLACADRPCEGVTSYSTIGLSDSPMKDASGEEFPARLEIAGACASQSALFANVVAAAAFCVMRTNRLYHPGSVMQGYVREYFPDTPVPHLYFTAPFLWEDSLRTLDCRTKRVSWLLVIPISDGELVYLTEHGDDALETLFEEEQIDVFDLHRPSIV